MISLEPYSFWNYRSSIKKLVLVILCLSEYIYIYIYIFIYLYIYIFIYIYIYICITKGKKNNYSIIQNRTTLVQKKHCDKALVKILEISMN